MLRLLAYLLNKGIVTNKDYCAPLADDVIGLPTFSLENCSGSQCSKCSQICPTEAISVSEDDSSQEVKLDLGKCITCAMCVRVCPEKTIVNNSTTMTAREERQELIISTARTEKQADYGKEKKPSLSPFSKSIACRVVSTGCSACDLEISATTNSIFDMERFGIHIVASPRFADVLLVTGPVPKAMHDALRSCYEAMAEPRRVIAVGTCAISGGLHSGGYTEANGVLDLLPVDVFIPGCPPHPWSIIDGVRRLMQGSLDKH